MLCPSHATSLHTWPLRPASFYTSAPALCQLWLTCAPKGCFLPTQHSQINILKINTYTKINLRAFGVPHRNVANNRTGLWDFQEGDGSSRDSEATEHGSGSTGRPRSPHTKACGSAAADKPVRNCPLFPPCLQNQAVASRWAQLWFVTCQAPGTFRGLSFLSPPSSPLPSGSPSETIQMHTFASRHHTPSLSWSSTLPKVMERRGLERVNTGNEYSGS